ncbi:LEAF RUST 10 DISEASE-RESISTANCE LOCUS RECEPTOR-LIKE PROTEIN KINASE-like 1.1 [Vicia villosa]|uniref:LEAF RUST 10 DISEASE-RESISTANCE LOCUS RECEPTOR-LIKE PROTEIN KINASE-like 1.1 n=1 Tax=Vicia villosa TaxID=3911 RepID=UPI00273B3836|nr:LEAF RUST 10 DISEASE-RESISTANCE LOCUS RECEPTOR-LIKE PROTEIN KINASE-like 1.1 [Vicia villosa]
MTLVHLFCFLLFCHLVLILSEGYGSGYQDNCPHSFSCGIRGNFSYPFTKAEKPDCGLILIHSCDAGYYSPKLIQLEENARTTELTGSIDQNTITLSDQDFYKHLQNNACDALNHNYTLPPPSPLVSFYIIYNVTFFRCNHGHKINPPAHYFKHNCSSYDIYYDSNQYPNVTIEMARSFFPSCMVLQFPSKDLTDTKNILSFVSGQVSVKIELSADCDKCCNHGGQCRLDASKKFYCHNEPENKRDYFKLLLGLGIGLGFTLVALGILIARCHSKRKHAPSDLQNQSRIKSYNDEIDPYRNQDSENGTVYFKIPLFSYKELEEATNNFHQANQLGSGGFGIVYYGRLQDGREVAVKRLYQHNWRRVEQFTNEIEILARTRHANLVSLYGCTSHHSDELLLVYEYVPNHTVDFHLQGDLARTATLPWHIRMKIAIETASSLAYLHASGIIHRDVKTKNLLLTNSFSVKVADFGLSRLFPHDITHASTAPQGTPGYVDPDYHQCYQLTNKSDVYSFGVVLVELISSKLAVDMNRHKDEINLSNLALKKIQKGEFTELVDPNLGFDSDNEVKRMIVSVAELAFQCLQREKELRPSMDEVLKVLMRIESGKDEPEHIVEEDAHPSSPEGNEDEIGLFQKTMRQPSPKTVVDGWDSRSTTSNTISGH